MFLKLFPKLFRAYEFLSLNFFEIFNFSKILHCNSLLDSILGTIKADKLLQLRAWLLRPLNAKNQREI